MFAPASCTRIATFTVSSPAAPTLVGMSKVERLNRRLAMARRECEDADRVWLATMARDRAAADSTDQILIARRLHAVWQERELARERVAELQRRLTATQKQEPLRRVFTRGLRRVQ